MRVITWNVNGIRSLKKSIKLILQELDSDVCCFQETKVSRSQLPENVAIIDGYTSYFSYPRKLSGYSGVGTYCKNSFVPEDAEEGLSGVLAGKKDDSLLNHWDCGTKSSYDLNDLDSEGRVIITYHLIKFGDEVRYLAIINVYCPRVDPEKPERHLYKMQFCHLLEAKVKKLCENGCLVMVVGDMNIACSVIDHCDPGDENEFNSSEARQWFKSFLSSEITHLNGDITMVDAFRLLYPDRINAYTCWNTKIGARKTNFGTRIDYILISSKLVPLLIKCDIMQEYEGSDHCPVFIELKCDSACNNINRLPSICSRLWPEFYGKQQTLQNYLKRNQDLADSLTKSAESNTSFNKKNISKTKEKQKSIKSFFKTSCSIPKVESNVNEYPEIKSDANLNLDNNGCASSEPFRDSNVCTVVDEAVTSSPKSTSLISEWKSVLKGPPKPPLCSGHSIPCVLRTVKKKGPNLGRQFFMCAQPVGLSSNPNANCNYFKWVTAAKVSSLK